MPGKPVTDQQARLYMTDRLHHSQRAAAARAGFLEMNGDSYRRRAAADRRSAKSDAGATTSSDNLDADAANNIKEDTAT